MTYSLRITPDLFFWVTLCAALCANFSVANSQLDIDLSISERQWLKQHSEVSIAYDGYFPPYSFLNDDGQLEGFSIDVFDLISESLGVKFNVYPEYEWNALFNAAQQQQVDVVATMVNRPERTEWFLFSEPYVFKSLVIIVREDDRRINQRDDVKGKTLALVKNYQYVESIVKEYPSIKPVYVTNMLDALNLVATGDVDAAITFLGAGHYYRNKYLLSNLRYAAVYDKNQANDAIAVRKDWPELVSILNKSLNAIPEHRLQELRSRWFPVDYMESMVEIHLTDQEKHWIKNNPNIRLGVDPEFAPFEYIEDGQYRGMASDYIKLLNQRLNINMKVVEGLTWKKATTMTKNYDIDVLPAVGKTEAREKYLTYTEPYLNFHRVIITRIESPFVFSLSDLRDKKIAIQENSSHHGYVIENSSLSPVLYKTLQESLMAVSGGEVDAFVGNVASSTYWIRKLHLTNLKIAAPVSNEVQSLHFAVRNDWPELVSILQKGLDTISPRQHKKISEKWLSVEYDPVVDYTLIWLLVLIFTTVLFLVVLWNLMLNRLVRVRTSQLDHNANYDQITDLPNRFLIMDRLSQYINEARRNHSKVALLSIDIDDFKKINDAFGHAHGDSLLREIAIRLGNLLRESDTAGRLSGDQFLVILRHFSDAGDTALLAEKILNCVRQSFTIENQEVIVTASVGISLFPEDGESPDVLLKKADSATHYAKEHSHGSCAFYTENLIRKVARRLELEQHMRGALDNNEFQVFYQPKYDAKTRRIVSFEALLRWTNEVLGEVSPAEFIPVAEKNGQIDSIGHFVLTTALKRLVSWQEEYDKNLSMAINLSPIQFRSEGFIESIKAEICSQPIDSKSIEFEITEGVLLSGYSDIEKKLKQLEELGVTLTMDDFGTGYSSMSYLRKYKFNTLKIDREFIADIATDESDRKLVSAAIAMAHGLDLVVVAEGVETEEQCQFLIENGCDILQGWLFSKAIPEEQVIRLMNSN